LGAWRDAPSPLGALQVAPPAAIVLKDQAGVMDLVRRP
jgi:hypothetical protein